MTWVFLIVQNLGPANLLFVYNILQKYLLYYKEIVHLCALVIYEIFYVLWGNMQA